MRSTILTALLLSSTAAAALSVRSATAAQTAEPLPCGPTGTAHVRTMLYFGLNRPTGTVSEDEWTAFLRDHVTPRFPDGLTSWEADGQWRKPDGTIGRERSKVLLLVHDASAAARDTLAAVVNEYKRQFEQESVLWESSIVCATF